MGLRTANLRRRVQIQARSSGSDANGEPTATWQPLASCWCDVRSLNGLQSLQAAQANALQAGRRVSIRVRWREDVLPGMRALVGDAAFEVKNVLPDEARREYLDLVCESLS